LFVIPDAMLDDRQIVFWLFRRIFAGYHLCGRKIGTGG